jgi:hypothetical protein
MQIKLRGLLPDVFEALINYLVTRPYEESAIHIENLKKAPELTAEVREVPKEAQPPVPTPPAATPETPTPPTA